VSALDVVLLLVFIGYGLSGLRQGLVVGLFSLAGFVAGAALAMAVLPDVVGGWDPGPRRTVVSVVAVLGVAWGAQVGGSFVGRRLRSVVRWQPARVLDSALGAVAAVAAVALVTWFVAGAVRGSAVVGLSRAVASSRVVAVIDEVVPPRADSLFAGFRSVVDAQDFPRVFAGMGAETIVPVAPPDASVVTAVSKLAAQGTVKIIGVAQACQRGREGSGFVAAPDRVVTNAHVVAGVDAPSVQVGGQGEQLPATVVVFDPQRDLAVLAVPHLGVEPLGVGHDLGVADDAVVAGYPQDGPFSSEPARVRQVVDARGQDIYGSGSVVRQVYSLAGHVLPGNSGGPLLDAGGSVVGVVFARSLDDSDTGYALTLKEVRPVLQRAQEASRPVSTGACTTG
jgi:S1-C subfamily serine protease